ncbi:MAG TPA: 4-hydroxy-tetrahydrodipicolinate synthase [Firmicutes bacterium]|nr:4-hydroxy-tetrahydrodipicolinate synthase [Bacillota bacterium]
MSQFIGSGVALITPFQNNEIDYKKLAALLEWHVQQQTDAIIICGTTGEAATMSEEEKKAVVKFTVETVNKRIPVIAGSGSNNTASAILFSQYCESVGVDGLLVVTPYYNKATDVGLIKHYEAIATHVNIPIILYNVPGRTGLNMSPNVVFKLSQIPNIVGIKEASGNISQVAEIARLCGENFYIYSGNDDQIVPVLSLGGKGVISVVANILPRETHEMVMNYLNLNVSKALQQQLSMKPLIDALFIEVNPIPVKAAMNELGMDVGHVRLPLTELSEDHLVILKQKLETYV